MVSRNAACYGNQHEAKNNSQMLTKEKYKIKMKAERGARVIISSRSKGNNTTHILAGTRTQMLNRKIVHIISFECF